MVKSEAKLKYPWLVECYEKGEYVDGSERDEDINTRVKKAFELITTLPVDNVAIVTHGVFMKTFFPAIMSKKLTKKEDGGFILIEVSGNVINVLEQDGIEIS